MIKGKEILGRSIIAISTGEKIDSVHDVIFDHQANQVLGLLVDEGGWFSAAKAVPFGQIRSIGEDAIMVADADAVTTTREDGRLKEALESKSSLIGLTLMTTDGQNLGKIADVFFDEHTGRVEGYEATGGLFADMSSGRTFVPVPESVQIGQDTAIVPVEVANAMQEQEDGGLKGALQSAGQSVAGVYYDAADSVKGAYGNIAEATRERQKEYVVGKTAGGDITAEDGRVIVSRGETITAAQADEAETAGKLAALATAATGGVIADAYGSARDRVQESYEDVKDATAERQKAYVTGKTAGSDITAADGHLIVAQGETITAAHADEAETAGKLAALSAAATGGVIAGAYGNARDRVQESYADVKDATAERQKAYVTGKTASSEIRTDTGEVIVPAGATITTFQADRAEQTGKLAALTAAATGGAISGGVQTLRERTKLDPNTLEATVGRRVRTDVRAPGGSLVAAQGQIVTQAIADRARHLGVQQALIDATTGGAADTSGPAAGAAVAGGLASVSEGAGNLLDRAKNWLGDKREQAGEVIDQRQQEAEEQKVRDALGRPVTRVILAPDDSIILNIGEIVTNRAVQAARDGNVLDILVSSVSKETPHIDPLASRPDATGEAALPEQDAPDSQPPR
ncbi:PRC-barrel domain-containing protein [Deinococcus aquaticus]|uniref:PRC-barrel domain-containing protein n=1 Tax=Deinococcus aquaticus TaxID=328692 RepID=A0ABY7V0K9_9DEIO|nr:PRC-barrel domain-containing protein [Deinococcus aquaticus]WDA58709.1 PRC-barrel domain-containing protein [Deinococcus aquaticus]